MKVFSSPRGPRAPGMSRTDDDAVEEYSPSLRKTLTPDT